MKNWLTYENGCWINGVKWNPEGFVTIDPAAVVAVQDAQLRHPERCCLIIVPLGTFCVMRSRESVVADIQSALP